MAIKSSSDENDRDKNVLSKEGMALRKRSLISFWIFGVGNNFSFNVMISAANDLLHEEENSSVNSTFRDETNTSTSATTKIPTNDTYLQCNALGTGTVLLAGILPCLLINILFPYFSQKIPYCVHLPVTCFSAVCSFVIVAMSRDIGLSLVGVVLSSFSSGIGETVFLSLTTRYHRSSISAYASGTGGASILAALVYAGLTTAGLSQRASLLTMTVAPGMMMLVYIYLLPNPGVSEVKTYDTDETNLFQENRGMASDDLSLRQKLGLMPRLIKCMTPVSLVYFAEYFINQGLSELLYFNGEMLSRSEQYRWYQVAYQLGVFISRSSVSMIHIQKLWILPVFQFANVAILLSQVFVRFIPSMWIILGIILWEGLLGGAAYVNTLYKLSNEIVAEHREFCLGAACLGDSVGISVAAVVAMPTHNAICGMKIKL